MQETDLYPPIKAFLETAGYSVKAEIGAADVVALRDGHEPVIVELKTGFSLALFHQGVARLAISDQVYLAVPAGQGRRFRKALADNTQLARRLGLGVMTVRLSTGLVEVLCDPGPFAPRKSAAKRRALMAEFARRRGDPNLGGVQGQRVTAYRQDALLCARHLAAAGACRGAWVKSATGVVRATTLMRDNHYGWFARLGGGVYDLTDAGRVAVAAQPG
ncbi:DUF2161 domain-containing phosphodiesterase [uncultured Roseicyclus sp.]|jgi:hypothetical protein|uniref:DUF2161 domain-containing phosphodiesterase n=1 Tax=uncultured Roseicyclus sp. TaxID=543072 RepID=UPI00260CA075|nr:DUF2161 family putative PD-(D/E)XK-type phosphodiesterase [uncultured Roseicyclus sp.]